MNINECISKCYDGASIMREVRGTKKTSRDCRYIVYICMALFTQTEPVAARGVDQADELFGNIQIFQSLNFILISQRTVGRKFESH